MGVTYKEIAEYIENGKTEKYENEKNRKNVYEI